MAEASRSRGDGGRLQADEATGRATDEKTRGRRVDNDVSESSGAKAMQKASARGMARRGQDYDWRDRNGHTHHDHEDFGNYDDSDSEPGRLSGSALVDSCLKILHDQGLDDADARLEDTSDDDLRAMARRTPEWESELATGRDMGAHMMPGNPHVGGMAGYISGSKQPSRSRSGSAHALTTLHTGYGGLPPDLVRPIEGVPIRQPTQQVSREDERTRYNQQAGPVGDRYNNEYRQYQYAEPINSYPYDDYYAGDYQYDDPETPIKKPNVHYHQQYRKESESDESIRKPSFSSYEDHSSEWSSQQGTAKRRDGQYNQAEPEDKHQGEPNLHEVIDYLDSDDHRHVAHAAGYLQHLSYKNDIMKARIRSLGAIPILIDLLQNTHVEVAHAAAGVLRNLCYGKANDENKLAVHTGGGFPALVHLLRKVHSIEVKELVCSVLWNISSYEPLKEDLLNDALEVLSQSVIVPECCLQAGFQLTSHVAGELSNSVLLRNATGILRNLSSASEQARVRMRACGDLVDALLYTIMSSEGTPDVDSKTIENCVCILRNLSYRLEDEVQPELAEEVVDQDWERAQETERTQYETDKRKKGKSSTGCFGGNKPRRKRTSASERGRIGTHLDQSGFGGSQLWLDSASSRPKRMHPVYGQAMLWQPEVVLPYLMLLKDSSNNVTLEAAAGALQNLSAGNWKWSGFVRNAVRKEKGLPILIELLQLPHDSVVRSVSTALRNMAVDPRNKELIGANGLRRLTLLLPGSGSTHLSDNTVAAVLCTIQEVITRDIENAKLLKGTHGIEKVVTLAKSQQQYPPKVVQTANQICMTLNNVKDLRVLLKKEGWNINDFQSSGMNKSDGTGNAASPVDPNDPAPSQSLRRHASTYSQYKEKGSRGHLASPGRTSRDDVATEDPVDRQPKARYRTQVPPGSQKMHRDSYEAPVASAREGFPEDVIGLYPKSYNNQYRYPQPSARRPRHHRQDRGFRGDERRRDVVVHDRSAPAHEEDDTWV